MAKSKKQTPLRVQQEGSFLSSLSPTKQDLLCLALLYLITLVLFRGIVFDDGAFSAGGDTANALTYARVGDEIKKNEGVDPLWMPHFFSGMPTFGNVHYVPHDVSYLQKVLVAVVDLFYLNRTWSWFVVYYFFCGVFTFFLLRVWKLSRVAALLGAITFMLSPYGIGLAAEGHGSKLMALSYLPLVFLLTHQLFERRDVLSFGLLAAGIGTLLLTNHMQIVYYVLMVLGFYLFYHIARDVRENKMLIPTKVLLFAGTLVIGLCISSYIYLSVYEYAQYSIRGGGTTGAKGGLTWEYATNWSFNPAELLTLLVPSFFGFSSSYVHNWQGQQLALPLYWGTMPFNTSSVYVGIAPIFFAVIALVYKRNKLTLFFGLLTLLVLLMSFGKHFGIFYELLFNTLPFFDKFRAPAMVLHVIAFTFAVLGAFGLQFLVEEAGKEFDRGKLKRGLYYTLGAIGLVLLAGFVMKSSLFELFGFTFTREGEGYAPQIIAEFKKIRFELLWNDYIKFVLLAGGTIGAVILYLNKTIKQATFGAAVVALVVIDLFIIDTKFIQPQPHVNLEQGFQPGETVTFLARQGGLFRVFPVGELYQETSFQYHGVQSVGGYSPAKLKIYQTVVDSCLYNGWDPSFPVNMNVVNMLNAKYIVAKGQLPPGIFPLVHTDQVRGVLTYENPRALPRAFFVGTALVANTDSEAFRLLNSPAFNPATTAILEKPLQEPIEPPDSNATASVVDFKSREIRIRANNAARSLLVLSEIYYPAGWKAFIDGKETEIYRTNSILRSVVVPAGSHEVLLTFDPATYDLGWKMTNGAWIVAAACVVVGLWRIPSIRSRIGGKRAEQGGGSTG